MQPDPKRRLLSLDIYRGLAVAGMILVDNASGGDGAAYWPVVHVQWNGWHPADFVFPSFLFIVGVAIVFSFRARLERGESRSHLFAHTLKRGAILFAIGVFLNGFPNHYDPATLRIEGVLQRIALGYVAAAAFVLWSDWRVWALAAFTCLAGYWVLMRFVPVPGYGVPGRDIPFLDPDRNLVAWLDRKLFMGHLYEGTRDPEGLLSTIPAVATALAGALTGAWLRSARTQVEKVRVMLLTGALAFAAGLALSPWFPINKKLWTSTFVLLTGGLSLMLLALIYWLVEMRNRRGGWTALPLVFGMNAIAAFVANAFFYAPMGTLHAGGPNGASITWEEYLFGHLRSLLGNPHIASFAYSLVALLFCWALLWPLYRKRIFLKI
jgi:predicted acyltransferase